MTEDLAEHFVGHGDVGLAANMILKLRLNHAEGALDIGSLVVMHQEFIPPKAVVVKIFSHKPPALPLWMLLKAI